MTTRGHKHQKQDREGMTVREAGKLGGEAVKEKYGPEFYSEIGQKGGETRARELGHAGYVELGKKGGEAVKEKYGPEFYSEIGQKGGEAVSQDRRHMSEIGRKGGEARGNENTHR